MNKLSIILLALFLAFGSACSLKKAVTTMTAKTATDGMAAVEAESDLWIAQETILPMIKMLEVMYSLDPKNKQFSALMTKAYGNVAFGFFEPKYLTASKSEGMVWRGRVERYYKLGAESGMKYIGARFGDDALSTISNFDSAISKAKKKDLAPLFWTAFNLGNFVNLNRDDVASIVNLPKVNTMIEKVIQVNPTFAYGAPYALKAAMLASRPTMLGGNPEKSKDIFEESIKISDGKYLMNKVMYAEWYAIPQKETALAKSLLTEVVTADPLALPEQALANRLAQERAKILLSKLR